MTGMTRGPLPARVYWVRRLMVLGIAALLVVGIAQLLGGGGGGAPVRATPVAQTSRHSPAPRPTGAATTVPSGGVYSGTPEPVTSPTTAAVLPSGPCRAADLSVTPSVPRPVAGRDVSVVLDVQSVTSPACYWHLSGKSLALQITSGPDLIWTTVQCARMLPKEDLVVRNTQPTRVKLTWDARRSQPGCPRLTPWALPGTYHLKVAALGGRPQHTTFALVAPTAPEVTRTAQPKTKHHRHQGG